MTGAPLKTWADGARTWLFDAVFPLWSTAGFDAGRGQFVEALALDGAPQRQTPRRVLVQARQLYVFSIAARLGWDGPWRGVMTAAADALLAHGRRDDGDWIFSFDPAGRPLDTRADLYTQAFAIFGLVHAAEALERPDLLAVARQTRARIDSAWRAPAGGGFLEGEVVTDRRRQNPHMHLFEAAIALCEAGDGEPEDAALAGELWDLFKARFYSPAGVVEFFDDALVRLADARGAVLEPGHAFEWSWLASQWSAIGGCDTAADSDQLYRAGLRGVGPLGLASDEANPDSTVKIATARCWPQTEWLKAALARHAKAPGEASLGEIGRAHAALMSYRDGAIAGAWRDRRLADGGWADGPAPASSGYHIVCALNALIRTAG